MRTLEELIDRSDPALPLVQEWIAEASQPVQVLEPSTAREDVLVELQVTTRSPMGAIAYETGGVLVANGWLRFLGSGNPRLKRSLSDWSVNRASAHLLFADDAVGGFFSLNGGAFGDDTGAVYYWAPDTLKWEPLGLSYTEFFRWALSDKLDHFYETLRWSGWESEVASLSGDECFNFYPFLWTKEGSVVASSRKAVGVAEQYDLNTRLLSGHERDA